jgi:hypothetical protein
MYKEPAFMRDLHRMQDREYERTKALSLHDYIELLTGRSREVLREWGLRERIVGKGRKQIIQAGK